MEIHVSDEVAKYIQAQIEQGVANDAAGVLEDLVRKQQQAQPETTTPKRKPTYGMFAHLGIRVSEDDIERTRKQAWANFPRDIPEGMTE